MYKSKINTHLIQCSIPNNGRRLQLKRRPFTNASNPNKRKPTIFVCLCKGIEHPLVSIFLHYDKETKGVLKHAK